ncbi:uncharacterized protein BKCO1_8700024 [Diplodia corticola]|uniref:Uncharacterized protein n=1 Tax=Diplodia corticola TaxID=236234 RepID=A0A1J9RNR5_9PEZI|nr:uncharacterized protein BKCO1_8700024 [Diplodia corticola]OJD29229.1 hypothetical protein BKCO1_8700024 [Diplodia corticola]
MASTTATAYTATASAGFATGALQVPKHVGASRASSSDRARSFRRTQYKKSAKARLDELVREITTARHAREARTPRSMTRQQQQCDLDESIKLLHDKHEALEIWSQELKCGGSAAGRDGSRSRSGSRTRGGVESGPE